MMTADVLAKHEQGPSCGPRYPSMPLMKLHLKLTRRLPNYGRRECVTRSSARAATRDAPHSRP